MSTRLGSRTLLLALAIGAVVGGSTAVALHSTPAPDPTAVTELRAQAASADRAAAVQAQRADSLEHALSLVSATVDTVKVASVRTVTRWATVRDTSTAPAPVLALGDSLATALDRCTMTCDQFRAEAGNAIGALREKQSADSVAFARWRAVLETQLATERSRQPSRVDRVRTALAWLGTGYAIAEGVNLLRG